MTLPEENELENTDISQKPLNTNNQQDEQEKLKKLFEQASFLFRTTFLKILKGV